MNKIDVRDFRQTDGISDARKQIAKQILEAINDFHNLNLKDLDVKDMDIEVFVNHSAFDNRLHTTGYYVIDIQIKGIAEDD